MSTVRLKALTIQDAEILDTILATYDGLFAGVDERAREAFKETVETFMAKGVREPSEQDGYQDITELASSAAYGNWNFHLVSGLTGRFVDSNQFAPDRNPGRFCTGRRPRTPR